MAKKSNAKRPRPTAKKAPARKQRIDIDKTVSRLARHIETLRQELVVIKKSIKLKKSRKKRR